MQGQRDAIESLEDLLEFDSDSTGMLFTPMDTETNSDFLIATSDARLSYINVPTQHSSGSGIWHREGPDYVDHPINHENSGRAKMVHKWPSSSLNIHGERGRDSKSPIAVQSSEQSWPPHIMKTSQTREAGLYNNSFIPCSSNSSNYPSSSNISSNPHSGSRFVYEDGQRLSGKRKNIEGIAGPSSTSGITNREHLTELSMMPGPSENFVGSCIPEEHFSHRFGSSSRGPAVECSTTLSIGGSRRSSQQGFRVGTDSSRQLDGSPPFPWNLPQTQMSHSNIWAPDPQSIQLRSQLSSGSQSEPQIPQVPSPLPLNGHPSSWSGYFGSRVHSSMNSVDPVHGLSASRQEITLRSPLRNNNVIEIPYFFPPADVLHGSRDPMFWVPASESSDAFEALGFSGSCGVGVRPLSVPSWGTTNPNDTNHRISEHLRRSLIPSVGPDSIVGPSSEVLRRYSNQSVSGPSTQEIAHNVRAGSRGNNQPALRSAFLTERGREAGLYGPFFMRNIASGREERSRMISEIRNALNRMQRADNVPFEDMFFLDQSIFYGGGAFDLYDRHREMRLDVDSMSYEEILALEERIGNVNTGLGEEAIYKLLKRRIHLRAGAEFDTEPCCICQEIYVEGEDLGTLQCGHDFHTPCIKQWLMHKNLCPICKEPGLVV